MLLAVLPMLVVPKGNCLEKYTLVLERKKYERNEKGAGFEGG